MNLTEEQIDKAIDMAVQFMANPGIESVKLKPYLCPAGKPTIGIGSTFYEDGTPVTLKDPEITRERAFSLCKALLRESFLPSVQKLAPTLETTHQLAAILSFVYNIGVANFAKSTCRKKILEKNFAAAEEWILPWNKARDPKTGVMDVLPGLDNRRKLEAAMFSTPD